MTTDRESRFETPAAWLGSVVSLSLRADIFGVRVDSRAAIGVDPIDGKPFAREELPSPSLRRPLAARSRA